MLGRRPLRYFGFGFFLTFLCVVAVCKYYLPSVGTAPIWDYSLLIQRPNHAHDVATPHASANSEVWASADDASKGKWVHRDPRFTSYAEMQVEFAHPYQPWEFCNPNPPAGGGNWTSEAEKRKAGEQRLVDVTNWLWKPDNGKMRKWDAEEFVVRMLQSPGGIIFIGDSITGQHAHTLSYLLDQADIPREIRAAHLPLYNHEHVLQFNLFRDHAKTPGFLARAGVPDSRLDRPIITVIEDHILLHEAEVREIAERLGASPKYIWHHDFWRVENWEEFVENATRPREGEESVTEDSIILINTGAHWSRAKFDMLPNRMTQQFEQASLDEAYEQMVYRLTSRLSKRPRTSIYFRTTSPGHPLCAEHAAPITDAQTARLQHTNISERLVSQATSEGERTLFRRWDWDLFERHNEIWRKTITQIMAGGHQASAARWFYLDMWEIDLQRPDSHFDPAGGADCLHWCVPSVPNEWTNQLFHRLFLESGSPRTGLKYLHDGIEPLLEQRS